MKRLAITLVTLAILPTPAFAASSDWVETEGARLRLVTQDAADETGALRGALEIDLMPGWKTYWKDPGDAGIAPQVDVSASTNVTGAELAFPAPRRFGEGVDVWAGYDRPVALPVTFRLADPQAFTAIDADVFLGVCEEICVPVQARLSVMPTGEGTETEPGVAQAFAGLPSPASTDFSLTVLTDSGDRLVADGALPADAGTAQLFVAAPPGWVLRAPIREISVGAARFVIPVAERPAGSATATALGYTLVTEDGRAVDGRIALP